MKLKMRNGNSKFWIIRRIHMKRQINHTEDSNIYYVYHHVDPITSEIVYVGKGCHGRAWDVTRCRNTHKEHQDWMKELCVLGYIPTDWVKIEHKNLSENEALRLEKEYFHTKGQPIFNRQSGEKNHQSKITDEQAREIYLLTKQKTMLHREIADLYGISRTAVSMIASRKQWKAATSCLV